MQTIRPAARGFTLIELLITLTIMAIVLMLAFPAYGRFIAKQQLNTARYDITTFIRLARNTAITEGKRLVVCPSSNQSTCQSEPNWHQGVLVFHDENRNRERDDGEQIVTVKESMRSDVRVTSSRFRRRISYLPTGRSSGTNLTITLCHERAEIESQAIVVSNTGRLRTVRNLPPGC